MFPRCVQFSFAPFIGHPHDPWGVADNVCGHAGGVQHAGTVRREGRGKCGLEGGSGTKREQPS
jgi:hypothetical protein